MLLKNLSAKIINCGVSSELKIEEAQIIRLTNLFGSFPIFLYLIYIITGLYFHLDFFWQIGLVNSIANIIGIWCNYKGYYASAKTILLATNSFILLLFINVVEGNSSAIAFFFPLLTCYVVFYDILKDLKTVLINLTISTLCIILCIALPPHSFGNVPLPENLNNILSRINYLLAFSSFIFYIYTIIKVKLQTEALLIQSKEKAETATKIKSIFLSNMSHELRTPLNGIIGTTNLLLQENKSPQLKQQLDVLKYSSEHMLEIINDILDYNKIEAGKLQLDRNIFNLHGLLEKIYLVFEPQFKAKNLMFYIECDERLRKEVISDDTRLNQVLSNLIANALKFTHRGSVTIAVNLQSSTSETMIVQFSVKDTGIGIAKNKQAEIFRSFTQADTKTNREFGGTGLGLTISKKLVGMFGGELNVMSEERKGSEFYFSIPIKINNEKQSFVNEEKVKELKPLDGLRVLVAEDNKINMIVTRRFLDKWKIDIKEATNGQEAVELFKAHIFDLVLIDLEMPVMDGYEAITEIRKLNPGIPALAFSAAVFENMQAKLYKHGFNDFISKPFRPEVLHSKIEQYALKHTSLQN